jgi:hypothetical protein
MKIRLVGVKLFRADGCTTYGQKDMRKLTVTFHSFAYMPKNCMYFHTFKIQYFAESCNVCITFINHQVELALSFVNFSLFPLLCVLHLSLFMKFPLFALLTVIPVLG